MVNLPEATKLELLWPTYLSSGAFFLTGRLFRILLESLVCMVNRTHDIREVKQLNLARFIC